MTKKTSKQTTAYSEIRDYVEVSEVPIIKLRLSLLTTERTIDARKLGINAEAYKNMPEQIQTKLKQKVIPNAAINPLDSIRKNVNKYMDDVGSKHDLFGHVFGHEMSLKAEKRLSEFQAEFNAAIMAKEDYEARCKKIIDSFVEDEDLKAFPWYDRFIEAIVSSQPDWDDYYDACKFEFFPFYIGESGTTSAHKFESARDSFKEICEGTKGNLIFDISKSAKHIVDLAIKNGPEKGIKKVTWTKIISICDKLQSLSFVSPSISTVEKEIRGMLSKVLPNSGDLYGIQRENLISILSMLVDPFKLSDKIDNGTPLFEKIEINLGLNEPELKIETDETKADAGSIESVDAEEASDGKVNIADEAKVQVAESKADEINPSDEELSSIIDESVSAEDAISDLASEIEQQEQVDQPNKIEIFQSLNW